MAILVLNLGSSSLKVAVFDASGTKRLWSASHSGLSDLGALSQFLLQWPQSLEWTGFEGLVEAWAEVAPEDLDRDRVGVFWALLFLCSQGKVELEQQGGLFGPLQLKRLLDERESVQLPLPAELESARGSARGPAREPLAA